MGDRPPTPRLGQDRGQGRAQPAALHPHASCLQPLSLAVLVDLPGAGSLLSALLDLNLASQEGQGGVEQQACRLWGLASGPLPLHPTLPHAEKAPTWAAGGVGALGRANHLGQVLG